MKPVKGIDNRNHSCDWDGPHRGNILSIQVLCSTKRIEAAAMAEGNTGQQLESWEEVATQADRGVCNETAVATRTPRYETCHGARTG
eukprot:5975018-Amphidinium_carterae.1